MILIQNKNQIKAPATNQQGLFYYKTKLHFTLYENIGRK